ncbi:MAG: hypothetical protein KDA78_17055, partial [Planctomycetaceae bacterium]|nr:hypothetical protein [Planctomycetaceae bacterium]
IESSQDNRTELDLSLDLLVALKMLPLEQRQICWQLMFLSQNQASAALGISRSTLQRRIQEIRQQFRHCGIEEFLGGH